MMKGLMRLALIAVGLTLLSGCAGFGLQRAERVPSEGNAFDRELREGYLELSRWEFDEADYRDSDRFAERTIAAARGEPVQPEEIGARRLPADMVGTLTAERQRLTTALAGGAAQSQPVEAAEAQVAFDCWMQEQEENFQPHDIDACRERFATAMASLRQPQPAAPAPPPEPAPAAVPPPEPFVVFFDFARAELRPDAQAELTDVIEAAQTFRSGTIDITGHTDLVGPAEYNQVLSERRANAVIGFLTDGGIDPTRIVGRGLGMRYPVIDTPAPEERNRRVEIEFKP